MSLLHSYMNKKVFSASNISIILSLVQAWHKKLSSQGSYWKLKPFFKDFLRTKFYFQEPTSDNRIEMSPKWIHFSLMRKNPPMQCCVVILVLPHLTNCCSLSRRKIQCTKVGAKNICFLLHLSQSYMKCKDFPRTHRTPVVGLVKFLRIHEDLFTATASRQFCVNLTGYTLYSISLIRITDSFIQKNGLRNRYRRDITRN